MGRFLLTTLERHLCLCDDVQNNIYPLATEASGKNDIYIGRIRRDDSAENALNMWVVADNIQKDAATNAVEIAMLFLIKVVMKLRDKIKDKAYFEKYFSDEKNRLVKFQTKLDNNEVREDRILPVKTVMHDTKYNIMVAKYSAGYPLEELKKDYIEVLEGMFEHWKGDTELSRRINMVSIGIMLEIEDEYFNILAKFIEETGEKEYMFDYLIHSRKPELKISDKVRFDSVFGWIKEVTQMDKSDAETFMAKYLKNKWYSTHKDFHWYDDHKSTVNVYCGYWCFEAGAIVKIMGLDDTVFKDNLNSSKN